MPGQTVWQRDRIKLPRRHALGLWLPSRKLASSAYVPTRRDRQDKLAGRMPFWVTFGEITLGASQMTEQRNKVQSDFWLHTLMISATAGANTSRVQIFDSSQRGAGKRFSITGINDGNLAGSAQKPLVLRRPYCIRAGHTIIIRILNLSIVNNAVQVVLHGVSDE